MHPTSRPLFHRPLAAALCLAGAACAPLASAAIFSVDMKSGGGGDAYTTGAGAFGDATTQWNEFSRSSASPSNFALKDETGADSSVTVTWTRAASGGANSITGAFAALCTSAIGTGDVVIGGLTPGLTYDLAVYDAWDGTPSITVGTETKSFPASITDWSTLTEGTHYLLFHPVASVGGTVTFTPNANPTGTIALKGWTAFQIQPAAVPEPAEYAFAFGLLGLGAGAWLRRRRAA